MKNMKNIKNIKNKMKNLPENSRKGDFRQFDGDRNASPAISSVGKGSGSGSESEGIREGKPLYT